MNSLYFTEEHELFRASLQDFLQKEVVPHIEKWEKTGTIERFIWEKFGEMGFFGIAYPEAYGGLNLDLFYTVVFIEELQIGGFTNEMGFYEIHHICSGNYHIRISHIGCETLKVFLPVTETLTFSKVLHHHAELIDEIIIHGEKQNNTTQASQTIKKEEIVLKGNKNLADLLEEITGIQSIKNGSGISKPVIHGLTGNRIAIVNNGIVQSGQQWGNDHAPEIDPFVAHHISVIKGTGALAYSGGSLGGIVLIEPKELDNEPHLHGQTHYITESNVRGHTANLQLEKKSKGF